ncbi:hypothetical protein BC826DRAFT_1027265 [Russula brevipes]|nr:hypothetical protein BC826DRAFT_1027265 [Russula brevipes]
MHTQVKANIPLCRHGMRDDCPVQQCHFRHANPSPLYSSVLKGPIATRATPGPTSPAATNGSFAQGHQFEMHDRRSSEAYHFQRARPSIDDSAAPLFSHASSTNMTVRTDSAGPMGAGANGLEQAADPLTIYRAWLESQVMAQKAKIQAMSSVYAIPIPNLDSSPFQLPSLSPRPPVANAESTITAKATTNGCSVPAAPAPTPAAPRLQLAQPVHGSWPSQGVPHHAQAVASGPFCADTPVHSRPPPLHQQLIPVAPVFQRPPAMSTAPKKEDMAYKTTPCRHFTLNQGWCPYGDGCGFIHDPELEWLPISERTSGRSTPSSTTLVGHKPSLPDKTAAESSADPPLSVSSRGAHCWGYIQGVCPHAEQCKYLHPADIVPYIKYTPCLIWPRCGYPAMPARLNTPSTLHQRPSVPVPRAIPTIPRPQASTVAPRAQTSSRTPLPPPAAAPPPAFIIPHEEAYAHAKLHHRPTVPSAETFSPAPTRPAVRLRRPSEDAAQLRAAAPAPPPCEPGRAIAVQRLDAEFAGTALHGRVRGAVKGHGRGKSLNL